MIFWTKPPQGAGFRICYPLDVSLGRCRYQLARGAIGHLHWSCIWLDGKLTQEEGRAYWWRPPGPDAGMPA